MQVVGQIIDGVLWTFIALMLTRFVVDWVMIFARAWSPTGALLVLLEVVYSVTDPPVGTVRRLIPPFRLGAIVLDLGFIVVLLLAYIALQVNRAVFL